MSFSTQPSASCRTAVQGTARKIQGRAGSSPSLRTRPSATSIASAIGTVLARADSTHICWLDSRTAAPRSVFPRGRLTRSPIRRLDVTKRWPTRTDGLTSMRRPRGLPFKEESMNRRISWTFIAAGLVATVTAAVAQSRSSGPSITHLQDPNTKAVGYAPASRLSTELRQTMVAQGSMALENPLGIIGWYGYENDTPSPDNPAVPQMVPTAAIPVEAQKTEPDKNTYLVLKNQKGADLDYDYGTHFLFQGHELAATVAGAKQGYITRINLDADIAHRVTLMATQDDTGKPIATIDGSTWDPFAQRLLFTTENAGAPTYAATASFPSTVEDVSGALGRGGCEGIQNDWRGNLWIVEEMGDRTSRERPHGSRTATSIGTCRGSRAISTMGN